MSNTKQVTVRVPYELLERAERLAPGIRNSDPKIKTLMGDLSRSDLLRLLILRGVESYESELDVTPEQVDIEHYDGDD